MLQTGQGAACRGGRLPGRARLAARRGVTLVELLVSMLILTIVCLAWLEIIGIQSARKEARRREAVERLAGMMDAFMYTYRQTSLGFGTCYRMILDKGNGRLNFEGGVDNEVYALFESDVSPIGYQIQVVKKSALPNADSFGSSWGASCRWLVGRLYDRHGLLAEAGRPFFVMPVCMGNQ